MSPGVLHEDVTKDITDWVYVHIIVLKVGGLNSK